MRDPEKTLGNMADKAKLAYLSYTDEAGFPTTRAMLAPRAREGVRVFYLTSNTSSQKVAAFRRDSRASLYFADTRFFRGISLRGRIEVLEDPESKSRIWREGDERYYPQGVDDPDYCVLKFTAQKGRYYSNFKSEDFEIPD